MTTERTFQFMLVLPDKPNRLPVLITGKRANLGFGWTAVRNAVREVQPLVPCAADPSEPGHLLGRRVHTAGVT